MFLTTGGTPGRGRPSIPGYEKQRSLVSRAHAGWAEGAAAAAVTGVAAAAAVLVEGADVEEGPAAAAAASCSAV
jgi:hypothetical protein